MRLSEALNLGLVSENITVGMYISRKKKGFCPDWDQWHVIGQILQNHYVTLCGAETINKGAWIRITPDMPVMADICWRCQEKQKKPDHDTTEWEMVEAKAERKEV